MVFQILLNAWHIFPSNFTYYFECPFYELHWVKLHRFPFKYRAKFLQEITISVGRQLLVTVRFWSREWMANFRNNSKKAGENQMIPKVIDIQGFYRKPINNHHFLVCLWSSAQNQCDTMMPEQSTFEYFRVGSWT